ncbi:MAG: trypsin-like peptidase domain-containing protein [Thermogemmata sp.]
MYRTIVGIVWIVILLSVAGGTLTCFSPSFPYPNPGSAPSRVSDLPLSACAWIRAGHTSGAGVLIDGKRRWLITARHVVGEQKQVEVVFPDDPTLSEQADRLAYLRRRESLRQSRHWVAGRVLRVSEELDVALIELEDLPASSTAARWVNRTPALGELLTLIGHRADLPTLWNRSAGRVRAYGYVQEGYFAGGRKVATAAHLLLVQLPIEEGDSGGPVFDVRGELAGLGVAVRRVAAPAALVVSAEDIERFLRGDVRPAHSSPRSAFQHPIDRLIQATVWVRPASANRPFAGFLVDTRHVVTVAAVGTRVGEAVGVAAPLFVNGRCQQQRHSYQDNLDLHHRNLWRWATIVASDPVRQITVLRLSAPFAHMQPLTLASQPPRVGEAIHAMNHPTGVEFAWVYAQGIVRQRGLSSLAEGQPPVRLLLGQLPSHAACPGGPVVNDRAELVGVWLEREGPAQAAYILRAEEVRHFLNVLGVDGRGPDSGEALCFRVAQRLSHIMQAVARGLLIRAEEKMRNGQKQAALEDLALAIRWDPTCLPARKWRLQLLEGEALEAEWHTAIEQGPFDSDLLLQRSQRAVERRDWRLARGDLQRLLAIRPEIAEAHRLRIRVLLELGEHEQAAAAVRDTLRADPRQLPAVARLLEQQTEDLLRKYPLQPQVARDWLRLAMQRSGYQPWQEAIRKAATFQEARQQIEYLIRALQREQP